MSSPREERLAAVIGGVLRQALQDAGARCAVVADDDSAEAELCATWATRALGVERVVRVAAPPAAAVDALTEAAGIRDADDAAVETHHALVRLVAGRRDGLPLGTASRTVLLLSGHLPPEPVLPLGDLWASGIEELRGRWSGPRDVRDLARRAGGVEHLDAVLRAWADERRPLDVALAELPQDVAGDVAERLRQGRFLWRRMGLVPKLGVRTLGLDLHY